jgi:Ca2+-binding RTX toxin-like protein
MFTRFIKTSTQIILIIIFFVFLTSILVVQAVSLDIPDGGKTGVHTENIRVNDLAPDQCNGIYVSTLLTGSVVTGSGANELIIGTSGDDILNGGGGNDCILGGGGNDTIDGSDGTDICLGGNVTTNCEF